MLTAVLAALLGGLILNGMPSVLPIISLKLLGIAGSQDAAARWHEGPVYLAALIAMLALTSILIALCSRGAAVGWKSQRHSPDMLGTTGHALVQPPGVTLLLFAALAVGFLSPLVLIALIPLLGRFLTRACVWMETVRYALTDTNTIYMAADSTHYNPAVDDALPDFGHGGLPLYVDYSTYGGEALVLPQLLGTSIMVDALRSAIAQSPVVVTHGYPKWAQGLY